MLAHLPSAEAAAAAKAQGSKLRLFTTFEEPGGQQGERQAAKAKVPPGVVDAPHAAPAACWAWRSSLAEEQLLVDTAAGVGEHAPLSTLVSPWFRHCLPAYSALLNSCAGVPGLLTYSAARAAWTERQVQLCLDADNCRQVVFLGAGLRTWHWKLLQQEGVQVFEVDSREVIDRKRALLQLLEHSPAAAKQAGDTDAGNGTGGLRASVSPRPTFVPIQDWKAVVQELCGKGFEPSRRSVVVAEGLLPYLPPAEVAELLADVAAITAPGSRLLFDALSADALAALEPAQQALDERTSLLGVGAYCLAGAGGPPGLATLAAAVAAKGRPFRSALKPQFSALVKLLQPLQLRLTELLTPAQLAAAPASPGSGGGASTGSGGGAKAAPAPEQACQQQLPGYYILVQACKMNPRLLLRDLPGSTTTAGEEAAPPSSWAAAAMPDTCLLSSWRSFWWLLFGGGAAAEAAQQPPADDAPAATSPTSDPGSQAVEPPGDGFHPPLAERKPSPDWLLDTAVHASAGSPGRSTSSAAGTSSGGQASRTSSAGSGGSAAGSVERLRHAHSIAPLQSGLAEAVAGASEEQAEPPLPASQASPFWTQLYMGGP